MRTIFFILLITGITLPGCLQRSSDDYTKKIDDELRAHQIGDMKFGYVCLLVIQYVFRP